MSSKKHKITDDTTRKIETFFRKRGFARSECYRPREFNLLLRVRITDDRFRGLSRVQREDIIEPLIAELPDEVQSAITMLVLVTPDERKTSLLSLEFDDPSRVML